MIVSPATTASDRRRGFRIHTSVSLTHPAGQLHERTDLSDDTLKIANDLGAEYRGNARTHGQRRTRPLRSAQLSGRRRAPRPHGPALRPAREPPGPARLHIVIAAQAGIPPIRLPDLTAIVATVIVLTACAATLVPAQRAAAIDTATTLRRA
jgi:hypothetical protein